MMGEGLVGWIIFVTLHTCRSMLDDVLTVVIDGLLAGEVVLRGRRNRGGGTRLS